MSITKQLPNFSFQYLILIGSPLVTEKPLCLEFSRYRLSCSNIINVFCATAATTTTKNNIFSCCSEITSLVLRIKDVYLKCLQLKRKYFLDELNFYLFLLVWYLISPTLILSVNYSRVLEMIPYIAFQTPSLNSESTSSKPSRRYPFVFSFI